jgi:hypothetical protein
VAVHGLERQLGLSVEDLDRRDREPAHHEVVGSPGNIVEEFIRPTSHGPFDRGVSLVG